MARASRYKVLSPRRGGACGITGLQGLQGIISGPLLAFRLQEGSTKEARMSRRGPTSNRTNIFGCVSLTELAQLRLDLVGLYHGVESLAVICVEPDSYWL